MAREKKEEIDEVPVWMTKQIWLSSTNHRLVRGHTDWGLVASRDSGRLWDWGLFWWETSLAQVGSWALRSCPCCDYLCFPVPFDLDLLMSCQLQLRTMSMRSMAQIWSWSWALRSCLCCDYLCFTVPLDLDILMNSQYCDYRIILCCFIFEDNELSIW